MSKGLEAWERIKKGIDNNVWECVYWDDIELIEKELKEYEYLDSFFQKIKDKYGIDDLDYLEHICRNHERLVKKDKALEIIKNKNVFVWGFIHRKEEIKHFEQTYDYYKTHYGYFHSGYKFELLTEEEYDLLKEVLL